MLHLHWSSVIGSDVFAFVGQKLIWKYESVTILSVPICCVHTKSNASTKNPAFSINF